MHQTPEKLRELLALSLDQSLNPEQAYLLNTALQNSEALQEEKAELLRLRSALAAWKPAPATDDFLYRVKQGIKNSQREALVFYLFPRIAVATILIAIGIATLSAYFSDKLPDKVALGIENLEPDDAYGFISSTE